MIKPPSGDLETALKVLEPGEEWPSCRSRSRAIPACGRRA